MEDEEFYTLIINQMDKAEDRLSALDKILKAFNKEEVKEETEKEDKTNSNLNNKKQ